MAAASGDSAARVGQAVVLAGAMLTRLADRKVELGVHEPRELGPALQKALVRVGMERVSLRHKCSITNWTRPRTEVDLVVLGSADRPVELVAELKAWDIGHQLFDLAKVACLLASGVPAGFLICVARSAGDFDTHPGGVLFPAAVGETRQHTFLQLIEDYRTEWCYHVGKERPEPTAVPSAVSTTAVAAGVEVVAYPGHSMRAAEVKIVDPTPVPLIQGWPKDLGAD